MPRVVSVFRSKFFWKIYSAFSLLFLATTLLVSGIVYYQVKASMMESVHEGLKDKLAFLVPHAAQFFGGDAAQTEAMIRTLGEGSGTRITLIKNGGFVLAESDKDPGELENHWDRLEVQQALSGTFGVAERYSKSVGQRMLYVARSIRKDGAVLGVARIAVPLDRIERDLGSLQVTIGAIGLFGAILALAIGWTLAKRVTIPISEMVQVAEALRNGKYEKKVRTISDDELGHLGDTLNRLGSELTNKISELHRLETVRRDFVANVSHEIKTPLTSIKGYVETLMAGAIDDPHHNVRFLEKIERNCSRLTALVQDILSLAKIEAGEDAYKPTPVEWSPIIGSVIARHEDAIHHKNLKIKVSGATHPLVVMGDKEAMTQVLDNLLTNAIKYTPEGGKVTVSLNIKGPWVRLDVEDTGIGIPSEHLDRIFERFYRVDKARSRDLGGTGLGLSIVKHLVQAMQGEIGVESSVGVGSRFSVRLKLAS